MIKLFMSTPDASTELYYYYFYYYYYYHNHHQCVHLPPPSRCPSDHTFLPKMQYVYFRNYCLSAKILNWLIFTLVFHTGFLSHFVFLHSLRRLLVTANVVPSSQILVTLITEALNSSETSVLTRALRPNIPEDRFLYLSLLLLLRVCLFQWCHAASLSIFAATAPVTGHWLLELSA
jgi:hypothetical protein